MSKSVASCVKEIMDSCPYMNDILEDDVISWANYADHIIPQVDKMTGKKCSKSAVVMAARRYGQQMQLAQSHVKGQKLHYNIVMKTNIFDINFTRADSILQKLGRLYEEVSVDKGDFLNVAFGTNEISLAVSEKYRNFVEKMAEGETVLLRNDGLVALTLVFSDDFIRTPGIIYRALKYLAINSVNVIELVSTMNELTFVIKSDDSPRAYEALREGL